MTQDSNKLPRNLPNLISSAWHSVTLSARPVMSRLRTIPCEECSQPIHAWNGRIWLIDGERWAHSHCWKGRLFVERHIDFMADEIRQRQVKGDGLPPSSQSRSEPSHNASAYNNVRSPVAPAISLREPVEFQEAQQQRAEELGAMARREKNPGEGRSLSMTSDSSRTSSSCIGRGTRISGKVEFRDLAKIEGEAEGEITGDEIEIAASAVVRARITANRVKVGGQVNAEIVARQRLEVLSTARLRGPITTPTLVVAEGAQFEGECKMPHGPPSSLHSESHETKEGRVSSFITHAQRAQLREHGYSDEDIAQMKSADAHRILGLD
jgi:cytoskeletal protein CcmA (bactofilin family)